ncbi:RagB/SusD family nutrient uptake outer membrane protein [Pedobacter nutrimenti]|uniref:RagB/SusD family nutrient uptake outer membrane protein n=1 Tax=Pedobacter nutrimenti TaxID=1241337 RepID=UPI00292CB9F5|nr:RagB/SusD family nutrient uptake outer membrane protein [Pedobacter nutrimenti]
MNFKVISVLTLVLTAFILPSCKKLVEVDGPATSVSSKNVYNNDATAIGAITSLYVNLSNGSPINSQELTGLSCIAGLSADEFDYYSGAGSQTLAVYFQNALNSTNVSNDFWRTIYQRLYVVNEALEGLGSSTKLTPRVKQDLTGEAYFMRAFYYFYLVNLYGDVPLVLSTDYTVNAVIKRSPKVLVYSQIVADLKEAQSLLNDFYLKGDVITAYPVGFEERVRPNKCVATAFLARTYLYMGEWTNAEIQTTNVLTNTTQFHLEPLNEVFLKNSYEAIWQLQPTQNGFNTQEANTFILSAEGPSNGASGNYPVYISNELIKDFEIGDQRKTSWIGSVSVKNTTYYYPYKYRVKYSSVTNAPITEYNTIMRLAELYLIRAESRARLGNLTNAISDIDQIRNRAGLPLVKDTNPNISQEDLLTLILKEKRIEFFTEWGHRWLDLKRTGKVDEVMAKVTPKKSNGGEWKSYQQYYPIWSYELQSNPNLIQTQGY